MLRMKAITVYVVLRHEDALCRINSHVQNMCICGCAYATPESFRPKASGYIREIVSFNAIVCTMRSLLSYLQRLRRTQGGGENELKTSPSKTGGREGHTLSGLGKR